MGYWVLKTADNVEHVVFTKMVYVQNERGETVKVPSWESGGYFLEGYAVIEISFIPKEIIYVVYTNGRKIILDYGDSLSIKGKTKNGYEIEVGDEIDEFEKIYFVKYFVKAN